MDSPIGEDGVEVGSKRRAMGRGPALSASAGVNADSPNGPSSRIGPVIQILDANSAGGDGASLAAFDSLTCLERLAALVPHPRVHAVTYHGVLAPASPWRD